MKKVILMLAILILSGCSDYKEVEELTIVTAIALDKTAENEVELSVEVVQIIDNQREVTYVTARGKTYNEAKNEAIRLTGNDLYFSHTAVMIIAEEVAYNGVLELVDMIYRSSKLRLDMYVLIAKDASAKEILQTKSLIDDVSGMQIKQIIESNKLVSEVPAITLYEFGDKLTSQGVSGYLPTVSLVENDGAKIREISGVGIFENDKLSGFLNDEQTKMLAVLENKVELGVIINEFSEECTTFSIVSAKSKITPKIENNKLSFDFFVDIKLELVQNGGDLEENHEQITLEMQKTIENKLRELIEIQKENPQADFLGLGERVYSKYNREWSILSENFAEFIENLEYSMEIKCEITASGLVSAPLSINY